MTSETSQTVVSRRGQTVVPAAIRRRHRIEDGATLIWIDDGRTIKVLPVPEDAVTALRGSGKGKPLLKRLLQERARDQSRRS
jgi:bifunctional DNA-binding transcriptional regulator/antitoxin component of YhaV-PrlF toxin-antitoxin module